MSAAVALPLPATGAPANDAGPTPALGTLRFLTCGSVDDGKSTLIGRLLHDADTLLDDQRVTLQGDSRRFGTTGDDIDFALLVDGLEAEREQGITIDVAYRFFATPARAFIVADTPGHEQYTRNMATGASNAELAVLLVDARNGLVEQTRRHAAIVSLLGIRHVVLAVNKIDLLDFDETRFREIEEAFRSFAGPLGFASLIAIPVSARHGDNVAEQSARTPWYDGPTLLGYLETVAVDEDTHSRPFRMPVQWVNRPNLDFRGLAGTIASGRIAVGDPVVVASSGRRARIQRIVTFDGDRAHAETGDAVTLVLSENVDAGRGDLLVDPGHRPAVTRRISAHLVWMAEDGAAPGRRVLLKLGALTVTATIGRIAHRLDVATLEQRPDAAALGLNEIGLVEIEATMPLAFDPYGESRETGGFILIDPASHATLAAGMIVASLDPAREVHRHPTDVDAASRERLKGQQALAVWLTGLSGSGKSTIANLAERRLHALGFHTMLLDGDNLRHGLNADLGFQPAARAENVRRTGEVARLMTEAGLIVLCALVSPFRADRQRLRELFQPERFVEVFVDAPFETCRARDPKGLYAKAESGRIVDLTGRDQTYEPPEGPELVLDTTRLDADQAAELLVELILERARASAPSGLDSALL